MNIHKVSLIQLKQVRNPSDVPPETLQALSDLLHFDNEEKFLHVYSPNNTFTGDPKTTLEVAVLTNLRIFQLDKNKKKKKIRVRQYWLHNISVSSYIHHLPLIFLSGFYIYIYIYSIGMYSCSKQHF